MKAFKEAGTICEEWYDVPSKGYFQRASRTDKGVSAAKMVVSMRMCKFFMNFLNFCLSFCKMEKKNCERKNVVTTKLYKQNWTCFQNPYKSGRRFNSLKSILKSIWGKTGIKFTLKES